MKKKYLLKFYFNYLVLALIFKNIQVILPFSFDDFNKYFFVYIPIAYLVIKYMFINELDKNKLLKKYYIIYIIIGYTIINILLKMPILYTIFIILFIIVLPGPLVVDEKETARIIKEYYENKDNDNK